MPTDKSNSSYFLLLPLPQATAQGNCMPLYSIGYFGASQTKSEWLSALANMIIKYL